MRGTNPFMNNDDKKNVIYDETGQPEGINSGIAKGLAKVYGFEIEPVVYTGVISFNKTTKKWSGMIEGVSWFKFYAFIASRT